MIYELQIDLPEYEEGCRFEKTDVVKGWQLVTHQSGVDKEGYKYSSSYAETISTEMADWLNKHYVDRKYLKLVKQEPKYSMELMGGDQTGDYRITVYVKPAAKDQAQLISEAVEALMEYIYYGNPMVKGEVAKYGRAATKARNSIMRENN